MTDYSEFDAAISEFQSQVEKQLSEKKEARLENSANARTRRARVLHQMMHIRKSLKNMAKLSLGDRFFIEVIFDDWEGWPRHRVTLVDSMNIGRSFPVFQVISHDRQESGSIEITFGKKSEVEVIQLKESFSIREVPKTINDCSKAHLKFLSKLIDELEETTSELSKIKQQDLNSNVGI